jgi:amino acid transporter
MQVAYKIYSKLKRSASGMLSGMAIAILAAGLMVRDSGALSLGDVINGNYRGDGQPTELFDGNTAIIPRFINLMLFIVGILSIIMLIFGGIRYVISGGDAGKVKDAKNTIMYAIVGLIVAILGYAIVTWVISVVGSGGSAGSV